jgi:hypothetical protein
LAVSIAAIAIGASIFFYKKKKLNNKIENILQAIIKTDNGAPFNSKAFEDFVLKHNLIHKPVTPYWSRANGQVERLMKMLTKCRKNSKCNGFKL